MTNSWAMTRMDEVAAVRMRLTERELEVLRALGIGAYGNLRRADKLALDVGSPVSGVSRTAASLVRKGLVTREKITGFTYFKITPQGSQELHGSPVEHVVHILRA